MWIARRLNDTQIQRLFAINLTTTLQKRFENSMISSFIERIIVKVRSNSTNYATIRTFNSMFMEYDSDIQI